MLKFASQTVFLIEKSRNYSQVKVKDKYRSNLYISHTQVGALSLMSIVESSPSTDRRTQSLVCKPSGLLNLPKPILNFRRKGSQ